MTTKATTATAEPDNGDEAATASTSETTTTTDTSTATDETDQAAGSTVTDEPDDEAQRLKFYQRKARESETELKKLRKVEEDRQRAELSESDRLKKDLADSTAELDELKVAAIRNRVSAENGLPAELAERLQGDTEEELAEDAKRLAELVGKNRPKTPKAGEAGIGVTGGDDLPTDPVALSRRFTAGKR